MIRRPTIKPEEAIAKVQAIYKELEARPIERNCELRTDCCHFKLTGQVPYLTAGEALVAARAVRTSGQTRLPKVKDGNCPLLDPKTHRCSIYESRPFGCRTHFCAAAGGPYPRRQVVDLIHRLEDIGNALGGDEARQLPGAITDMLFK